MSNISVPEQFDLRMRALLGDNYKSFAFAFYNNDPVRSFRINTLKVDEDSRGEVIKLSSGKIPFCDDGYYTELNKVGSLPLHHAGAFYMQDPAAMSVISSLDIPKDSKVLDACAAPGGKTTQIASVCSDGFVVANEYVSSRAKILQGNIERMGCTNVTVTNLDTKVLSEFYREYFDIVITDAPCSGEGMFRKNDMAISEWNQENVHLCAKRQEEILNNTCKCVADGGYLVYSTCTYSLEENEITISKFLKSHPDFELCAVKDEIISYTADGINIEDCQYNMSLCRRFYPHISPGEGQFIALMKRKCSINSKEQGMTISKEKKMPKSSLRELNKRESELINSFLNEVLTERPSGKLIAMGNNVYLAPDIPLPPFGVYMTGVAIGSINGDRIIPHHQFFSAFGSKFKIKVELSQDSEMTQKYLRGEEISYHKSDKGWCAVTIHGCPVGGGKISLNTVKNHYPKGLRNR